jgi:quercetin dioxygenase-like cupin family protein
MRVAKIIKKKRNIEKKKNEILCTDLKRSDTCLRSRKVMIEKSGVAKAKALYIVEIIEYISNSVVTKTIIKKTTGNVSVLSFDSGEGLSEKTSPFDSFVQIIDGKAEIIINGKSFMLGLGQSIIIPAHASNSIKANERFIMIMTTIKSGYE